MNEQENRNYLEYIYVLGKHFARVDGNLDNTTVKKYFYHADHLGSTVAVTDEAGQAVWSSEYTPFGNVHSVTGELAHAAQFTGKDLDEDIGLYYFNARWYDSDIGRFVEEDPIQSEWLGYFNEKSREQTEQVFQLAQGNEKPMPVNVEELENEDLSGHNLEEIDGCNLYWFVENNPLIYIDPDGFAKKEDNPDTKINETAIANGMSNAINASKLYGLGELLVCVPVPGARALAAGYYLAGGVLTAFSGADTLCVLAGVPGPSEYVGNVLNALGDSLP